MTHHALNNPYHRADVDEQAAEDADKNKDISLDSEKERTAHGHNHDDEHVPNCGLGQSQQCVVNLDEKHHLQGKTTSYPINARYPVTKIKFVISSSMVMANSRQ